MVEGGGRRGPVVQAAHLRKTYGRNEAVRDVSLTVAPGQVFGFLGPNGAGKTTTLKMLLGLVTPTSGEVQLMGRVPADPESRRRVGFLPEHFRFPPWFRAGEFLDFHAALLGIPRPARPPTVRRLLNQVGLEDKAESPLGQFSKGMLQRVGLAQALLGEPRIVFLDEPTSGLDPLGRRLVRDIIRGLRASGVAVFLNSHLLGEVEAVCDHVAIVSRGRVVHEGPPGGLPGAGAEVEITLGAADFSTVAAAGRVLPSASLEGRRVRLPVPSGASGEAAVAEAVKLLVGAGVSVVGVNRRQATLEEVFMAVVEHDRSGD